MMPADPNANLIYVLTSLFLGVVALFAAIFGPYVAERVKGRFLAPRLRILWGEVTPHCIKTFFSDPQNPGFHEDVYYFRFRATNEGKSQARTCEAVLENLWIYDAAGRPHNYPDFAPRNLGFETDENPVTINPNKKVYCPFGHISSPTHQASSERQSFTDIVGDWNTELLRFSLEGKTITNGQPNCLVPGKYAIQVTLYSENASPAIGFFTIDWRGNWQSDPVTMFKECVIQYTSDMPQ